MSTFRITNLGNVVDTTALRARLANRSTLHLPQGALALRALRPSYRSTVLPKRLVRIGQDGFTRDASGYCAVPVWREVPVFEKRSRLAH